MEESTILFKLCLLTGEVESSPAYQMMVSAVGQLSRRVISEIIGVIFDILCYINY